MELRNTLASQLGVELGSTVALDYPTLPALAKHIVSLLPALDLSAANVQLSETVVTEPAISLDTIRCMPAGNFIAAVLEQMLCENGLGSAGRVPDGSTLEYLLLQ